MLLVIQLDITNVSYQNPQRICLLLTIRRQACTLLNRPDVQFHPGQKIISTFSFCNEKYMQHPNSGKIHITERFITFLREKNRRLLSMIQFNSLPKNLEYTCISFVPWREGRVLSKILKANSPGLSNTNAFSVQNIFQY